MHPSRRESGTKEVSRKLKSVTEGSWAALLVLTLPLIAALLVLPEIPLHLIYGGDYDEAANACGYGPSSRP